eukprot:7941617-Pyramimonas_sp.AAC.1
MPCLRGCSGRGGRRPPRGHDVKRHVVILSREAIVPDAVAPTRPGRAAAGPEHLGDRLLLR